MKWLIALLLLTACAQTTGYVVKEYGPETEVYFCPIQNCRQIYYDTLSAAKDISCAVYDTDLPEIVTLFKEKHAKLVVDDQTSNRTQLLRMGAVLDSKYSQMHNKFCILDNQTVITGSMNPTFRDTSVNYNNLLIIHSKAIAQIYNEEFDELHNETFSGGKKTREHDFYLNDEKTSIYFCPEDWCANRVIEALNMAQESIYFMDFSFTHDKIGDMLIEKYKEGVIVEGIMEKSQNNPYTEFPRLQEVGIPVIWEETGANLHHKVFIVDKRIVITGSMNPSLNGDTKNDENTVIVESSRLGNAFYQEYRRITK